MKGSEWDDTPVLITEAAPSADDQHAARKRRYVITMLMRIPCLILAAFFINSAWWLAVLFVAISIPLPWIAVLMANDRPARRAENVHHFRRAHVVRELESRDHPVIDG
ncbi:MAG TPA: DUF3099 domain-containing protein [Pseudonocardiaceae bacterium]